MQVGVVVDSRTRTPDTCVTAFGDGNWHLLVVHLAVTSGVEVRMYVDGVTLADAPMVVGDGVLAPTGCMVLGARAGSCNATTGAVNSTLSRLTGVSLASAAVFRCDRNEV